MADFDWYCYVWNGCRVFTVLFRNETRFILDSAKICDKPLPFWTRASHSKFPSFESLKQNICEILPFLHCFYTPDDCPRGQTRAESKPFHCNQHTSQGNHDASQTPRHVFSWRGSIHIQITATLNVILFICYNLFIHSPFIHSFIRSYNHRNVFTDWDFNFNIDHKNR